MAAAAGLCSDAACRVVIDNAAMRSFKRDAARHVATTTSRLPAPTVRVSMPSHPLETLPVWNTAISILFSRSSKDVATRRAASLQTHPRQPLMGRGRGNLRENREDPAPTVGICGDIIAIQMLSHYRRHARTVHPACRPPREPLRFLQRRGMGREGTRYARHLPYQERNSQSRKLIEM